MKDITCFITSLSSGGAEHQLVELAGFLSDYYKVSIVTFSDIQDHYLIDNRVSRIRLSVKGGKFKKFLSIFGFFLFIKTDCVISFGQRENLLSIFPLLFRRKIKIIAGERNLSFGKTSKLELLLFNFIYRRADYIVSNSHSQQKYILNKKPYLKNKVVTITNYTDLDLFHLELYPNNNIIKIGVFARYHKQKNYERFILAVKKIKDKINTPFIIEWYGNMFVKDSVLNPDYVHFVDLVVVNKLEKVIFPNNHIKNVHKVLSGFDAICLPSLHEGFSNSISEAICCGKPMIVSDVSDNSLMVSDGINGFVFDPLDVDCISESLLKFINLNENERYKMALESRKIAESIFDKEKFINDYRLLIDSQL